MSKNKSDSIQEHNQIQRAYYENRLPKDNWRMVANTSPYVQNHLTHLIKDNALSVHDRVLDVGCGMGKFTIPLASQGFRVEGLDLSPYLLKTLTDANQTGHFIPTHVADILMPPEALKNQYDLVIGCFMLHHLLDMTTAFTAIKTLLKAGGRIGFIDVNALCPLYYAQIFLSPSMRWKAEKGVLNLTQRKLKACLTHTGFTDIKIQHYGIMPPFIKNNVLGDKIESYFDRVSFLKPVAAFTSVSARIPNE